MSCKAGVNRPDLGVGAAALTGWDAGAGGGRWHRRLPVTQQLSPWCGCHPWPDLCASKTHRQAGSDHRQVAHPLCLPRCRHSPALPQPGHRHAVTALPLLPSHPTWLGPSPAPEELFKPFLGLIGGSWGTQGGAPAPWPAGGLSPLGQQEWGRDAQELPFPVLPAQLNSRHPSFTIALLQPLMT